MRADDALPKPTPVLSLIQPYSHPVHLSSLLSEDLGRE